MKTWLKTYNEAALVDTYWDKTFEMRRREINKIGKKINIFLEQWPKFSGANGPEYVRKDFFFHNQEFYNHLIETFTNFSKSVLNYAFTKCGKTITKFNPEKERSDSKFERHNMTHNKLIYFSFRYKRNRYIICRILSYKKKQDII